MNAASPLVIAIDGPSASGKSTVSRLVAESLDFLHVDTGSMYRAVTWKALAEGIDPRHTPAILELIGRMRYECEFERSAEGPPCLVNRLDGVNPGPEIRTPRVEEFVSVVAAIPQIREWMARKQRDLIRHGSLVMEGRDIGTVVFPETPFKFYLDANPEVRAQRRAVDQGKTAAGAALQEVGRAIAERDWRDRTRAVAPLKVAEDAIRLDTSASQAPDVADIILRHIRSKHLASP